MLALKQSRETFMPLKLKGLLLRHDLKQSGLANAMLQSNGKPLSVPSLSGLLNWNVWPISTPTDALKQRAEQWLLDIGIPREELAQIWQIDDTNATYGKPALVGGTRKSNQEPDIEPLEVEMLSPNAKRHFKMFRDPFVDDVNGPDDVFLSGDQRYIAEAMFQTAKHGGFLAVCGESGSGKSTLRKMLVERLRDQPIRLVFPRGIDKKRLTTRDICQAIIQDLAPGEKTLSSLEDQARQVERVLMTSARADNMHVLLIEEAHDLTIPTLKHLKRFYELEDGFRKLLSIILVGQPELKDKLDERRYPEAREVIRRCEIAELLPLDNAVGDYLTMKFKRVNVSLPQVLAPDASEGIRARLTKARPGTREVVSQMYPLVVNNLITKAMNRAAELGIPVVTADLIREL